MVYKMKNKLVLTFCVLLVFGFSACDMGNSPDTSGGKILTYLKTVDTLTGKNILPSTLVRNVISDVPMKDESTGDQDRWYTLEELFEKGEIDHIYQLNIDPDPSWFETPFKNIKIKGLPTTARYIFAVQQQQYMEGDGGNSGGDAQTGSAEYRRCYTYDETTNIFTHKEGENWYFIMYDQVEHLAYGDKLTMFITQDIENGTVKIFPAE
jgi:hypothetical protein